MSRHATANRVYRCGSRDNYGYAALSSIKRL